MKIADPYELRFIRDDEARPSAPSMSLLGVFLAVVEFAELFIDRRAENTGDPVRPV